MESIEQYFNVHFWPPRGTLKGNYRNIAKDKWKAVADIPTQFFPSTNRHTVFVILSPAESVTILMFKYHKYTLKLQLSGM